MLIWWLYIIIIQVNKMTVNNEPIFVKKNVIVKPLNQKGKSPLLKPVHVTIRNLMPTRAPPVGYYKSAADD